MNGVFPDCGDVYIHILEGHDSIEVEGEMCFAMYDVNKKEIYVAGDLPQEEVLKSIAHEFAHHIQAEDGVEFNEEAAEKFTEIITNILQATSEKGESNNENFK